MLLESRVVGRKTPLDGKLEISPESAAALRGVAPTLTAKVDHMTARATISAMPCGCEKGRALAADGERHTHFFVESELFISLVPGDDVRLVLDREQALLTIERVSPA